jgi:hypothetical protein
MEFILILNNLKGSHATTRQGKDFVRELFMLDFTMGVNNREFRNV